MRTTTQRHHAWARSINTQLPRHAFAIIPGTFNHGRQRLSSMVCHHREAPQLGPRAQHSSLQGSGSPPGPQGLDTSIWVLIKSHPTIHTMKQGPHGHVEPPPPGQSTPGPALLTSPLARRARCRSRNSFTHQSVSINTLDPIRFCSQFSFPFLPPTRTPTQFAFWLLLSAFCFLLSASGSRFRSSTTPLSSSLDHP